MIWHERRLVGWQESVVRGRVVDQKVRVGKPEAPTLLVAVRYLTGRLANESRVGRGAKLGCVIHGGGKGVPPCDHVQMPGRVDCGTSSQRPDEFLVTFLVVSARVVTKINDEATGRVGVQKGK